jgi:hypothetical protein
MDREKEDTPGRQVGHAPLEGAMNARAAPAGSSAHSELRRRLLLRGLVGGPVVLAGMRPVRTLAKAKKYCQYSGWHSFKVNAQTSASPNGKTKCTSGKRPPVVKKRLSKLPKDKKHNGGKPSPYSMPNYRGTTVYLYQSTTFRDLFGSGSTNTLSQCLQGGDTYAAFLTALYNAYVYYSPSGGYPLQYTDVYAVWDQNWTKLSPGASGLNGLTPSQAALFFEQLDSIG